MVRKLEALTSADIAGLAVRAEDLSHDLGDAAEQMEKKYTADPGDAVEVLRQLARLAETAMMLSRMVAASAKMRELGHGIERRAAGE